MPSLRELQDAIRRSIIERDDLDAASWVVADGIAPQGRLSVYRNTFASTLIRALRLSHPAVDRLVGTAFFDAAAREFITLHPPRSSYLDEFGGDFADFLQQYRPAASVPYLADVARLEWAVSRAIHAVDTPALTAAAMSAVELADHERICFQPQPSVSLVHGRFPVDEIWRAVLDGDDAALPAIDLQSGPVWLIVQRRASGVEIDRLDAREWQFMDEIFAGCALGSALAKHPDIDAARILADLFVHGRCMGFSLVDAARAAS